MKDAILALLSMWAFGLVCGMMLRDWQDRRRLALERETQLRRDYDLGGMGRIPNMPNIPPPPPPPSDRPNMGSQ
jgi:hypothetical protein